LKCPYCGVENPEGRELCSECGQTLIIRLGQGVDEGNPSFTWATVGWCLVLASFLTAIFLVVDWWLFPDDPLNLAAWGLLSLICLFVGISAMGSKTWLKTAAVVVVVILAAYFGTGYLVDSVKVRATLYNNTDSDMNVVVFLDPHGEERYEPPFTLEARNQTSIVFGHLPAGHHSVEVRWSAVSSDLGYPDGEFNYTDEFYIMPYMMKYVDVVIYNPSSWPSGSLGLASGEAKLV